MAAAVLTPEFKKELFSTSFKKIDYGSINEIILEHQKQSKRDMQELKAFFEKKYEELSTRLTGLAEALVESIKTTEENYKELYKSHTILEAKVTQLQEEAEHERMSFQFKETGLAIRIRGLLENPGENLRETLADIFVQLIGQNKEEILWQLDYAYRVNSRVAIQKNLSRDVVLYFVTRKLRNDILQISYNQTFHLFGNNIKIFKELPAKIWLKRKDYGFLTDVLKIRKIRYRWIVPIGITVFFDKKEYHLRSTIQAQNFYSNILKCGTLSAGAKEFVLQNKEEKMEEVSNQEESASEMDLGSGIIKQSNKKSKKKKGKLIKLPN